MSDNPVPVRTFFTNVSPARGRSRGSGCGLADGDRPGGRAAGRARKPAGDDGVMDRIIDQGGGREQRRRAVAKLDVDVLLTLVDAANEYIVAGLCGDPTPDAWRRLLVELRNAGLADS